MALTRRYPTQAAGDTVAYGMDFSNILPWGMVIASGLLKIFKNTQPPVEGDQDWPNPGPIRGGGTRHLYQEITGGVAGTDYILEWSATDNRGNVWVRSGVVLCAPTS